VGWAPPAEIELRASHASITSLRAAIVDRNCKEVSANGVVVVPEARMYRAFDPGTDIACVEPRWNPQEHHQLACKIRWVGVQFVTLLDAEGKVFVNQSLAVHLRTEGNRIGELLLG